MSEISTATVSGVNSPGEHVSVLIVGGGPTGLFLAAEMARAGVKATVLERRPSAVLEDKAHGVLGQSVRLLDARGIVERAGRPKPVPAPAFFYGGLPLPLAELADSNPLLTFPINQSDLEQVLRDDALALGVDLRVGCEVLGFDQASDRVEIAIRRADDSESRITADYLVGCDGSRSMIRKQSGFGFPGVTERIVDRTAIISASDHIRMVPGEGFEVEGYGLIGSFMHRTERGVFYVVPHDPAHPIVGTSEWGALSEAESATPMTVAELEDSVERVLGVRVPLEVSSDGDRSLLRRLDHRNSRVADHYRDRRVFIAGDAAHVSHGPTINTALQDAANLAWKLAAAVRGVAPLGLLDTYESERHPLGERVRVATESESALLAPGGGVTALRTVMADLLRSEDALGRIAGLLAGSDARYGEVQSSDSPLVGWFIPPFDVSIDEVPRPVSELMRDAEPLLIDATANPEVHVTAAPWLDRVTYVPASSLSLDEQAVLIRPDGYVAWAGGTTSGLSDALYRWFGDPR